MKEINLIISQEQFEQNRKNKILQEKTRYNYESYEFNIKRIFIALAVVLIFVISCWWLNELGKKGIKGCMENGYSENYCIQHS